jgi:hypothetical protein
MKIVRYGAVPGYLLYSYHSNWIGIFKGGVVYCDYASWCHRDASNVQWLANNDHQKAVIGRDIAWQMPLCESCLSMYRIVRIHGCYDLCWLSEFTIC